jgi:hypothetical protein
MARFLAGAAACFLLLTGAFLFWQSQASQSPSLPSAPPARSASGPSMIAPQAAFEAPEADPRSREEKRFGRADQNKDGKIQAEEIFAPRRKAFAKLDLNGNGALSFEEWAAKTIEKFRGADKDRTGWLTPAEYATTAPPPPKHKRCSC